MNVDERIRAFEPFWGKWRIEGEAIGNGTFGQVYTVVSEDFGKVYEDALKHISIPRDQRELAEGYRNGSFSSEALAQSYYESSVQRLQKEIDLMYKFRGHSHIVNYQDHLIIAKKDMPGYDVFIRMEKLKTLYQVALEKGGLKQDDIIKIGLDICDALKTVHENKIIHRDIKPENVFYGKGEYKLGDFGVARTLNHTDKVTAAGTTNYMAPEIYRYGPVNSTADIYSLGIMLYRLLNGNRAPFLPADRNILITPNQEEEALSMRMRGEALPPLLGVDDRLMQVIRKACAFQPADRFQSAEEMTAALQACSGVAFSMPNISNATVIVNNSVEDQSSVSQTKSETKTETASQPANPRKKWVFPVVACGVLAIAVLALILLLGGKPVNEIPELDYKVMADNSVYLSWNECRQAVRYVVSGSDRDDGTELLPLTVTTSNYYLSSEFKTGNAASYQVSAIDADNEEEASGIIVVKLRQTAETTPTEEPTVEPTPTEEPTAEPTPTEEPTAEPTPTEEPTAEPTPTEEPTAEPTPTEEPTAVPTEEPTAVPTPTEEPTAVPTLIAEPIRTEKPTAVPAEEPTAEPTATFAEAPEFAAMSQQDYYDLALKNLSEGRKRAAFYNFLRAGDYQDAKLQARMCGNVVLFASSGCTDFAAVDSNGTVHFEDVSGHAFSETLGDDIDLFVNGFDWCWAIDETGMEYFYRKTGHSLQIDLPNKVEHKKLIKLENAYACYVGLKEDGTVDLYESDEMSARFDVNEIETWKNIVDIEASPTVLVGLRADGTVVIAGENAFRHDVSGWKNIKAIAVDEAVVGLREDGTVITTSEKVDVSSWKNIVAISTGGSAVFGIKSDGTVVVADWWNSISDFDDSEVESWEDIVAIEANSYVVIGMKSDGSLVAATSKGVLYSSHDKQQWKELWRTVSNWNLLTDIHAATPKLGEKIIDAQPFQPAACKHRMTWQVQTPATCGKAGEEAEICELCGEVGESRPLDPLGHAYELSSQQAATCGEAGYEEYTCSRCGVGYQETLAATGAHTMEWKTTQAATCAANGIKVQKCKVCGATGSSDSIAVLGHAYSKTDTQAATCGTAGYEKYTCSRCGDSYKETLAATGVHTMEWKTTQAATCTANGVKVQKCKACGATGESDSIAKLGHAYSKTDTKAATCGTAGYEKYTCSRCNASYQNTLAATGNHSYGAWQYYSADQDKRTCSCGAADYRSAVWSSWSSWSTTAVSASNTRQVETQTVTIVTGTYTKYTYNRWRYIGKNGNAWYHYREATDIDNYVRGGEWQYKTTTEPLAVAGSVYGRTYYEGYWYLVSTETIEETEEQIQYRYRTRQY